MTIRDEKLQRRREEELFQRRILFMGEAVTSKLAQSLVQDLLLLGASEEPISLYVNSPGGEVHSGFAIFDAIGHIQAPVKVICTGLCASIATVIAP